MRNRAKCKLCNDIIESYHPTDLVYCSCGQIGLDKGDGMKCMADNWENFLRIDDDGKEIPVTVQNESTAGLPQAESCGEVVPKIKPDKKEIKILVDEMIKNYENLPQQAMYAPTTHADLLSVLLILSTMLAADS